MPNYNHARYLPRAIEGILNQTRPPDEFLILDDASTDDSASIIESYAAREPTIRFVRNEENAGVIAAHEKLYRMAKYDYLYSAAADDDRTPRFFECAMQMAEQYPSAGIIFGKMVIVDESGTEIEETEVRAWQEPVFATPERFLREFLECEPAMQAMTGATVFRTTAFRAVGWCPPELGSFADTFAARAIALRHGACYVPERFYVWHRMQGSFSQQTAGNVEKSLEIVERATALMLSDEFRDIFPADYVRRWATRHRYQAIWNYVLGPESQAAGREGFLRRNVRRLPRLPRALQLLLYQARP